MKNNKPGKITDKVIAATVKAPVKLVGAVVEDTSSILTRSEPAVRQIVRMRQENRERPSTCK